MYDLENIMTTFLRSSAIVVVWGKCSAALNDERYDFLERVLPTDEDYIASIHAFSSVAAFAAYWNAVWSNPEEQWYWVIDTRGDEPYCFCVGACDPHDDEVFEEYLGDEWRDCYV